MIIYNKVTNKLMGVDNVKYLSTPSYSMYESYRKDQLLPRLKITEDAADKLEQFIMKELKAGKSVDEIMVPIEEGMFGQVLGGLTGFALGNKIGGIICKCLGIGEGVLKDLLTSRLFGASLGAAIGKNV